MKLSVRAPVCGPLGHQASHGLGTTGGGEAAVHQAQAVLASTAARTLALGVALNNSWLKATVISMATAMAKLVNRSDDYPLIAQWNSCPVGRAGQTQRHQKGYCSTPHQQAVATLVISIIAVSLKRQ